MKFIITIEGNLPLKYQTRSNLKRLEKRISGDAEARFGEYEIWGEYFGDDDEIYALFLKSVKAIPD